MRSVCLGIIFVGMIIAVTTGAAMETGLIYGDRNSVAVFVYGLGFAAIGVVGLFLRGIFK